MQHGIIYSKVYSDVLFIDSHDSCCMINYNPKAMSNFTTCTSNQHFLTEANALIKLFILSP